VSISILGIFVADLCFFGDEIPIPGKTVLGKKYIIGPGGKGSNQAIAAARAGGDVSFVTKLGKDNYADMALKLYQEAGVNTQAVIVDSNLDTGAAGILINQKTGENAINVIPGAAATIDHKFIDDNLSIIKNSKIFLTQLETSIDATIYALKMAKENGCTTILNPAPARNLPEDCFKNIDFFTPNETEASFFINQSIENEEDCQSAAKVLLNKGVKNILITLGDKGCFFKNQEEEFLLPAKKLSAPVVDTTGAGDAFNGAFSVALSKNKNYKESIEFANLVAGISVTREGAANSMPTIDEIEENLQ
jgi:ribokinase